MVTDVLVRHGDLRLPGVVLFEFDDEGRRRCLVRYELPGGIVVRRLHWCDELLTRSRVLELPLQRVASPAEHLEDPASG